MKRTPIRRKSPRRKPQTRIRKRSRRTPLKRLKNKLTDVFQAMVRERDKELPCISCGENKPLQAGHYMGRTPLNTRWHPQNVNGQCGGCNGFSNAYVSYRYSVELDKRYGQGTAERMANLFTQTWKPNSEELESLIAAALASPEEYVEVYARIRKDQQ